MDKQKSIKVCELFKSLDNLELEKISREAIERKYVKASVIFTEGEKGDYVYIVTEGMVKTSKYSLCGKENILDIFVKGDLIDPVYVFCGDSYPYSAIALDKASVLLIRKEKLITLMEKSPAVSFLAMKTISKKLLSAYCKIQEKTNERVEQRIAKILLILFKKIGGELSFTREEIANMVGTSFETGKRKIKIINEQKLRLIAEGFLKSSERTNHNLSNEKKLLTYNVS